MSIGNLVTQVSTGSEVADALHAEIDEARDLLREGEPLPARLLLQRLRTKKWDRMEPRHHYRVLANIGAAYLAERNFSQAARCLIDAVAFHPDDSQAAENEALGYYISTPPDEAFTAITSVGEFQGMGRGMLVAPGDHKIKIALPGYKTFETEISTQAHQKVEVKTDLPKDDIALADPALTNGNVTQQPPPPPPPQR